MSESKVSQRNNLEAGENVYVPLKRSKFWKRFERALIVILLLVGLLLFFRDDIVDCIRSQDPEQLYVNSGKRLN